MLDAYAGSAKPLQAYTQLYSEWKEKSMRLEDLRNSERANEQELDLLKFQVEEIDSADLKPEEEEEIEETTEAEETETIEEEEEATEVKDRLEEIEETEVREDQEKKGRIAEMIAMAVSIEILTETQLLYLSM